MYVLMLIKLGQRVFLDKVWYDLVNFVTLGQGIKYKLC